MKRALRLSLGVAGVLFAVACADEPGSVRTPTAPTGPALSVSGAACDNALYNLLTSKGRDAFTGGTRQAVSTAAKAIKDDCGTTAGQEAALAYASLVIANKATGTYVPNVPITAADQARAQVIADLIDLAVVYGGVVSSSSVPFKSLLPGGGAKVCPQTTGTTGGECVLITEGYVVAGIVQFNLTSPTGSHLYMLQPGTCSATNLQKVAPYCVDLSVIPPASNFNPELQGFVCTDDQDHAPGGGDENNSLVNVSHGLANGNTEVLKKPAPGTASAALSTPCTHGTQPTYAVAGLGGVLQGFLARATNVVRPRMLYAINAGPPFTDNFGDGFSPLGAVNRQVFLDDFADETVGNPPVAPIVGQAWTVIESGAGNIRVQGTVDGLTKAVAINQAAGCTTNCGPLELRGKLQEENGEVANNGSYSFVFDAVQSRPTIVNANLVLRSADSLVIATLRYATVGGLSKLQYLTTTGFVDVGTWTAHVAQNFEIIVNLDAKTTTLKIGGVAAATNIGFVTSTATSWRYLSWENGFVDSGKTGWDNISVVRLVDP